MVSEPPQKQDYKETDWPHEDHYIHEYLDKRPDFKEQQPYKHRNKDFYYVGEWDKDLPHGNGIIYIPNVLLYEGPFVQGRPKGKGIVQLIKLNCQYSGNIVNGQASGEGRFVNNQEKYTFIGEWENSKPKNGKLWFTDNNTIINFEDYEKGTVQITYDDQKVYHGQIDLTTLMPKGVGSVIFPDSSQYNGQFLDGKMHGHGHFIWKNAVSGQVNQVYQGDYQYGKKHGYGIFTFASGNIYQGQWFHGKRQGKGVMVDKNRKQISRGNWKQGQFLNQKQQIGISRINYSSNNNQTMNPNISSKDSNGYSPNRNKQQQRESQQEVKYGNMWKEQGQYKPSQSNQIKQSGYRYDNHNQDYKKDKHGGSDIN